MLSWVKANLTIASCRRLRLSRPNTGPIWYAASIFLCLFRTPGSSNDPLPQALKPFVNARPYPIEPDPSTAGLSLPAPSLSLTDPFGDLHPPGVNRPSNPSDNFMRPSRQDPLFDWWTSQEKPWDPIQGRNQPMPRNGTRLNYRHAGPAFSAYRSHAPSECETIGHGLLPSDSGYESLSRPRHSHSVIAGSIHGDCDRSGETTSVSNGLAGLQFDRSMSSSEVWRQSGSVHTIDVPVHVESKDLICRHCGNKVKTKSELKYDSPTFSTLCVTWLISLRARKHQQRHEKPHHCNVPGCLRTEGFSTPNDVDRHMRSCHPELVSTGKYYICTVQNCRAKEKKWPRADNFRQHLKRVHRIQTKQEDIEQYVYR